MGRLTRGEKEPGFDAVRAKYGPAMVEQIRNWPIMERNHMLSQGWKEEDLLERPGITHIQEAERNAGRASRDKDYALAQAEVIARRIPEAEWGVVKTPEQLRRRI